MGRSPGTPTHRVPTRTNPLKPPSHASSIARSSISTSYSPLLRRAHAASHDQPLNFCDPHPRSNAAGRRELDVRTIRVRPPLPDLPQYPHRRRPSMSPACGTPYYPRGGSNVIWHDMSSPRDERFPALGHVERLRVLRRNDVRPVPRWPSRRLPLRGARLGRVTSQVLARGSRWLPLCNRAPRQPDGRSAHLRKKKKKKKKKKKFFLTPT